MPSVGLPVFHGWCTVNGVQPFNIRSSTGHDLSGLVWPGNPDQTIVLVHGLASNARTWIAVGDLLNSDGNQVVAYDQRSHGQSARVSTGFDFPTYVADLDTVVSSTTTRPPVTVGQSWGGNVVVEHAAHHPVAAVVGLDGGFIRLADRFANWEACAAQLSPPRFNGITRVGIEARLRTAHPDWSDQAIGGALANFEDQPDGTVLPHLTFENHMMVLRSLWEHDPAQALARASGPSHAIVARSGPSADPDATDLGFDNVVWLDGDHDLHLQQPDTIAKLIQEITPWGR